MTETCQLVALQTMVGSMVAWKTQHKQ